MEFPIPRSFCKDPLRGWRSTPCREALDDWFHVWHTSWDKDFLICGEDSHEVQVGNFVFDVNYWTDLSRQTCHIRDLRKATWEWQEGMLMQFLEILMGHYRPDVEQVNSSIKNTQIFGLTIHWRMRCEWRLFGLIEACPWKGNWLKGVSDMFDLWETW